MDKLKRILEINLPSSATSARQSAMIFIAGPRQVGKTHTCRKTGFPYFNWDTAETKKAFLKDPYFFRDGSQWVIFDEIHKRRDWKKLMKGYFDSDERRENFIVTGSGRFNLAQRGGDSLQGRYDLYHLMPVIYREYVGFGSSYEVTAPVFKGFKMPAKHTSDADLLHMGGFPEPLMRGQKNFLNKWQDLYLQRLVQEDVRDFSRVVELDKMELLARMLPSRVCAPLSMKSLAEDLEVSRDSIKTWLRLFETLYLGFAVPPWSKKIHRAVKKERKWYFFQWTFNEDPAARFENYVATQLYALCQMWRDHGLGVYELFYLRDQDRREVDFLITKNMQPVALIEARLQESNWHTGVEYYANRLRVPSFIVTSAGKARRIGDDKWILPAAALWAAIS